jgi:pimeloyl-ACP methyl ester carboxylesterase
VLRPNGAIRDVVIFGHGWKSAPPATKNAWVTQFRPWLDHLVQGGSAVIFPRYQLGAGDSYGVARVRAFRAGVTTGLAALGRPRVPVVAAGYSYGAALALTYAADARTDRLPVPRAVDAIFPAQVISGSRLPPLDPSVDVLIQIGDRDLTAGRAGGDEFWSWLRTHPASAKRYELVRSTPELSAIHSAPKLATAAARRAFWEPLDRLIALARRG